MYTCKYTRYMYTHVYFIITGHVLSGNVNFANFYWLVICENYGYS